MGLEGREAEIAETLYRAWDADKQVKCLKRQLCRIGKTLCALGEGILSEIAADPKETSGFEDRGPMIVAPTGGQKFSVKPASQIAGKTETQELPLATELAELLQGYRQACTELEERQKEADDL